MFPIPGVAAHGGGEGKGLRHPASSPFSLRRAGGGDSGEASALAGGEGKASKGFAAASPPLACPAGEGSPVTAGASALKLNLDIDAGRQLQPHERVHGLRGRVEDIDQPLVRTNPNCSRECWYGVFLSQLP